MISGGRTRAGSAGGIALSKKSEAVQSTRSWCRSPPRSANRSANVFPSREPSVMTTLRCRIACGSTDAFCIVTSSPKDPAGITSGARATVEGSLSRRENGVGDCSQTGHSFTAGALSWPHSGQIQWNISNLKLNWLKCRQAITLADVSGLPYP
jgi:hypothetical protein